MGAEAIDYPTLLTLLLSLAFANIIAGLSSSANTVLSAKEFSGFGKAEGNGRWTKKAFTAFGRVSR